MRPPARPYTKLGVPRAPLLKLPALPGGFGTSPLEHMLCACYCPCCLELWTPGVPAAWAPTHSCSCQQSRHKALGHG